MNLPAIGERVTVAGFPGTVVAWLECRPTAWRAWLVGVRLDTQPTGSEEIYAVPPEEVDREPG